MFTLEVSHRFLLLSTQNIFFYTLIMKKSIQFHHRSFVNGRKKLNYTVSQDPATFKTWIQKNLNLEKRGKKLDAEKRLEAHIVQFINTEETSKEAT